MSVTFLCASLQSLPLSRYTFGWKDSCVIAVCHSVHSDVTESYENLLEPIR